MRKASIFGSLLIMAMMVTLLSNCKKEEVKPDPEKEEEVKLKLTLNSQGFNIDENSAAATVVGNVAYSFNGNNADLSFSFTDTNEGFPFLIDETTGSITVKTEANLDHETKKIYEAKIQVTHKTDNTLNKSITTSLSLNDLDERPDAKLKAYYPLDGNVEDKSGNEIHGTMEGVALSVPDRFGVEGMAYHLNEANISFDSSTYFNAEEDFTISTWIYLDRDLPAGTSINSLMHKVGMGRDFLLGYDGNGRINFHLYNQGYIHCYTPNDSFKSKEWVHVIANYAPGKLKIYINGVLQGERDTAGRPPVWTSNVLKISGESVYFDEVRFYDASFTEEEIMKWHIEESVDD